MGILLSRQRGLALQSIWSSQPLVHPTTQSCFSPRLDASSTFAFSVKMNGPTGQRCSEYRHNGNRADWFGCSRVAHSGHADRLAQTSSHVIELPVLRSASPIGWWAPVEAELGVALGRFWHGVQMVWFVVQFRSRTCGTVACSVALEVKLRSVSETKKVSQIHANSSQHSQLQTAMENDSTATFFAPRLREKSKKKRKCGNWELLGAWCLVPREQTQQRATRPFELLSLLARAPSLPTAIPRPCDHDRDRE